MVGMAFRRRKWTKSGGNDVMLLDELSQGWSKKLLPRLAKKKNDDYTNYKRKMQEQQNELIPPPTLILLRLLRINEKTAFYITNLDFTLECKGRKYVVTCRILMKYIILFALGIFFLIFTIHPPYFDNWILCDLQ